MPGVPNYFSIYCYIRALHSGVLGRSATIPVCNVGTLVASAAVGLLFFAEARSVGRLLGIGLAIASIAKMALG